MSELIAPMETEITWRGLIACPVCGSQERHWYQQVQWGELAITFWICVCGIVYGDRVPTDEEEIRKYYNEYYTPLVFGQHGLNKLRANELVRAQRLVWEQFDYPEVKRHLDVGCAYGLFMQEMQTRYDCISEGLDLRDLAGDGYKVYTDPSEVKGTYDLITVIHTLEHTTDPVGFLKALRPLCSKNLFIEVPNFGPSVGVLSPHHVFGFTTHSLPMVAKMAGFSIVKVNQVIHEVGTGEDGVVKGKIELQLLAEVKDE